MQSNFEENELDKNEEFKSRFEFEADEFLGSDEALINALGGINEVKYLHRSLECSCMSHCIIPINNRFTYIEYKRLDQILK